MTSIEWFVEQLEEHLLENDVVLQLKNTEAFEHAKEMHKQELIDSCKYGYLYRDSTQFPEASFEDYCKNNFLQSLKKD